MIKQQFRNITALFFYLLFVVPSVLSQSGKANTQPVPARVYPQDYFRNPLAIPMSLSANFGELRSNHWHMGLDIRTNRQENLPVSAAAEGYVARVSVQAFGFGQAIYVNHPNGLTTVYGHLNAFYPALAKEIRRQQYEKESWAIDISFPPGRFPVGKGQQIALSGNTGGSQGPHVHFEIRDTKTEKCLNPLLFGFSKADKIDPYIGKLALYDRNQSLYEQSPKLIAVTKAKDGYYYASPRLVETTSPRVSFAINATDRTNISSGPNGIYAAKICIDDKVVTGFKLEEIGYDETLYLNAQIDYRYRYRGGVYLQHLSKLPGDNGPVYWQETGDGVIGLADTLRHKMEIEVRDANGNISTLRFDLRYKPATGKKEEKEEPRFLPGYVSVLEKPGFEAFVKEGTLYDFIHPDFSESPSLPPGAISPLYKLNDASIPVHERFSVRIRPSVPLSEALRSKAYIKRSTGKSDYADKVKWEGDWMSVSSGSFGTYQAFTDTEAPVINSLGTGDTLDFRKKTSIVFRPTDNNDVIRNFRAELDGEWLMFTNDKGRSFIYRFDERFPAGVHLLKVSVEDLVGNKTVREFWIRK